MADTKVNVNSVVDTLGDALKLATNLTDIKKEGTRMSDDSNNTVANPNQTVQIQLANNDEKKTPPKPVIIREKPETHIHKDFPDERALTDKECELALAKAKMDNEYKMKKLEYEQYESDLWHKERAIKEAQERKDRLEREAKIEKRNKVRNIVWGIIGAVSTGLIGYGIYSDYKANQMNAPIKGDGSVK